MDPLLEALSHYGLPGAVIAVFVGLYVMKDRELKAERDARNEDAKEFRQLVIALQEKLLTTANRLTDVFEELKKLPPRRSL